MLARPEIGSKEDILLFLAGKPEAEKFTWGNAMKCAVGQYWRDRSGDAWTWGEDLCGGNQDTPSAILNIEAQRLQQPRTFGQLYKVMCSHWGR